MGRMSEALERTIAATGGLLTDRYSAQIELCRLLAEQVDEEGARASTRLTAAYLSGLKDLARATATTPAEKPGTSLRLLRDARAEGSVDQGSTALGTRTVATTRRNAAT